MFSYLFSAKKSVEEPVVEKTDAEKNALVIENEQLKAQIQVLLAEKVESDKMIKNLRRDSAVYRDLMFTKVCTCNN
jgi:hypothetical protein